MEKSTRYFFYIVIVSFASVLIVDATCASDSDCYGQSCCVNGHCSYDCGSGTITTIIIVAFVLLFLATLFCAVYCYCRSCHGERNRVVFRRLVNVSSSTLVVNTSQQQYSYTRPTRGYQPVHSHNTVEAPLVLVNADAVNPQ